MQPIKYISLWVQSYSFPKIGFAVGRSLIALAQVMTVLFTSYDSLMQDVLDSPKAPYCDGIRAASIYCISPGRENGTIATLLILFFLLVVLSGFFPRYTAFLHAWVSFSLSQSIALPDGGEAVALVVTLLLIPIAMADSRKNHWARSSANSSRSYPPHIVLSAISLAGMVTLRVQLSIVYFHSAVGKFVVDDWVNGTAEFYILRGKMFGASGFVRNILADLTNYSFFAALFTWGPIVLEIVVILCIWGRLRARIVALVIALFIHVFIGITVGIWSFAIIMIGAVTIVTLSWVNNPSDELIANQILSRRVQADKIDLPAEEEPRDAVPMAMLQDTKIN